MVDALARQIGHAVVQRHERSGVNDAPGSLIDRVGITNIVIGVGPMGRIREVEYLRPELNVNSRKILARLNEEAKSRFVAPYAKALVLTGLGEKAQAIDELERAYREGTGAYLFVIKVDPFLDDLRGDPRFEELVQKVIAPKAQP